MKQVTPVGYGDEMNILVVDKTHEQTPEFRRQAYERLLFGFARFSHRIHQATVSITRPSAVTDEFTCEVLVNVEGVGKVRSRRTGRTAADAVNLAVSAAEPKLAFRVDWKSWFNFETLATWLTSKQQPLLELIGQRPQTITR